MSLTLIRRCFLAIPCKSCAMTGTSYLDFAFLWRRDASVSDGSSYWWVGGWIWLIFLDGFWALVHVFASGLWGFLEWWDCFVPEDVFKGDEVLFGAGQSRWSSDNTVFLNFLVLVWSGLGSDGWLGDRSSVSDELLLGLFGLTLRFDGDASIAGPQGTAGARCCLRIGLSRLLLILQLFGLDRSCRFGCKSSRIFTGIFNGRILNWSSWSSGSSNRKVLSLENNRINSFPGLSIIIWWLSLRILLYSNTTLLSIFLLGWWFLRRTLLASFRLLDVVILDLIGNLEKRIIASWLYTHLAWHLIWVPEACLLKLSKLSLKLVHLS